MQHSELRTWSPTGSWHLTPSSSEAITNNAWNQLHLQFARRALLKNFKIEIKRDQKSRDMFGETNLGNSRKHEGRMGTGHTLDTLTCNAGSQPCRRVTRSRRMPAGSRCSSVSWAWGRCSSEQGKYRINQRPNRYTIRNIYYKTNVKLQTNKLLLIHNTNVRIISRTQQ